MPESAVILTITEAEPIVSAARLKHDRVASLGVPAHITLLYPWCPPPIREADLNRLRLAIRGVPPFQLMFRGIGRFERVLFLRPDDQGQIVALIASIAGAFPEQPPYGGRFSDPVPHLTVAEVSGDLQPVIEELAAGILQLLPFQAEADALTVIESDSQGLWSVAARLPLGHE